MKESSKVLPHIINLPPLLFSFIQDVHVVVELVGTTMGVQVISAQGPTSPLRPCSLRLQDSLDLGIDPLKNQDSMLESIESESINYEFSDYHGKNIQISDERRAARRLRSYNHGIVIVSRPLCRGQCISVNIFGVISI